MIGAAIVFGVLILGAIGLGVMFIKEGIFDHEPFLICSGGAILLLVLGFCIAGFESSREEAANPCIAWGPTQTTMMFNPATKTMMPTTYTPCVRRQHEVEK